MDDYADGGMFDRRAVLYLWAPLTPEQRIRIGRLLAALTHRPDGGEFGSEHSGGHSGEFDSDRCDEQGVPRWLRALLRDVLLVGGRTWHLMLGSKKDVAPPMTVNWGPAGIAEVLRVAGFDPDGIPALVFLVWIQDDDGLDQWLGEEDGVYGWIGTVLRNSYGGALNPKSALPGVEDYLADQDGRIPDRVLEAVTARQKRMFLEGLDKRPRDRTDCPRLLAALAVDGARTVRRGAVELLDEMPETRRHDAVVERLVATTRASRLTEVVAWLASADGGERVLEEASSNPVVARAVGARVERRGLFAEGAPPGAEPPAAELLAAESAYAVGLDGPEEPDGILPSAAPAARDLRRRIDDDIERHAPADRWGRSSWPGLLLEVTDADIDRLVAITDGADGEVPEVFENGNIFDHVVQCPALRLEHLCRIEAHKRRPAFQQLVFRSERPRRGYDALGLERVFHEHGIPTGWEYGDWAWRRLEPEQVLRWAMETPEFVLDRLRDEDDRPFSHPVARLESTLEVLALYPSIPQRILVVVADIAVGTIVARRRVAQAFLRSVPGAREFAERALTADAATREAAALWLADLADPAAVPALRRAVAKERATGARAAILHALAACGDDTSDLLSAEALGAEAAKGLKGKIPPSLVWFDMDDLPTVHWADGSEVDRDVVRWWVVKADKVKNPNGHGLWELYLDRLVPQDAAALGSHVFDVWLDWLMTDPDDEDLDDRARPFVNTPTLDKGLLALTVRMDGAELAEQVGEFIREIAEFPDCFRHELIAMLNALAANGRDAALALLRSVAQQHKLRSVEETATELLDQVAVWRGWSAEELADRVVPTGGFDPDGLLHLTYGKRGFTGRLTDDLKVVLTDDSGRTIGSLPEPRAAEDTSVANVALKELRLARRRAKEVRKLVPARLYEAMCGERRWSFADWRTLILGHPLVGRLAGRLIWQVRPADGGP